MNICQNREGMTNDKNKSAGQYLDELGAGELEEAGLGLRGAGAGHHRLPGAGRAVQQHALGWLDAQGLEPLLPASPQSYTTKEAQRQRRARDR